VFVHSRGGSVHSKRAIRIEFSNPAAEDLFGYADGGIIGSSWMTT
jgi:hypothetical protein